MLGRPGRELRVAFALVAALAGVPAIAKADAAGDELRADKLERAGALATSLGEYTFAARAFDAAYALTKRPELLFREAEADRQRYALEGVRDSADVAIALYQRFVADAPNDARADDARRSLEALAAKLEGPSGATEPKAPAPDAREAIAVSSSISTASLRVDGAAPIALPAFVELAPGTHLLSVGAPGFEDALAVVEARAGAVDAEEFPLDPKPAHLVVDGPPGADVFVDGVGVGTAPFPRPLDVDPGAHAVVVSMGGHHPRSDRVVLERGETKKLSNVLAETTQRKISWALVGVGGAALAAGIGCGVGAVVEDRAATGLEMGREGTVAPADQAEHDRKISTRDDLRVAAGVAAGTGLALVVVGGFLHALDTPAVPHASKAASVDVAPWVGEGIAGFGARGTF